MEKPSPPNSNSNSNSNSTQDQKDSISSFTSSLIVSKELPESYVSTVLGFLKTMGVAKTEHLNYSSKDFYSDLVRSLLKVESIQRGKIVCTVSVKPFVSNFFGRLHGGAVAVVAERVSIACTRTVVPEDKEIFLGEQSISYLSGAPLNAELKVEGSVVRSGRNLTVVAIEFRFPETEKLVYTARSTIYHMPTAKL